MALQEYRRKRDFTKTQEPSKSGEGGKGERRFVIQKHDATRLHYDFRLELGRTLKSWALPKGMPYVKGEKRLAVQVEDHPLSYREFEGTIPKGEYGGGTVMVWDIGTYRPLSDRPTKDLAAGKLHVVLRGKKLKGEWYLVRLREGDQWLMIKGDKDIKPPSARAENTSALSGHTMKALAKGDHVWHSDRSPKTAVPKRAARKAVPIPEFVEPMQALLVTGAPRGGGWLYEIKFDGFRALALKGGAEVKLMSRNEKDLGKKFPMIVESFEEIRARRAIIDGEIVALDSKGRSSFQLLQAFEIGEKEPPLFYYAFDLLELDGKDMRGEPLSKRKEQLKSLIADTSGLLRYSDLVGEDAGSLLPRIRKLGLEGLIGKRKDSSYECGRRSGAWIKLKIQHEQEFVIGGYTPPGGSRKHFGALLVGVYQRKKLVFVGKVGTGFSVALLQKMHRQMQEIEQAKCPFTNLPEKSSKRYGQALTAAEMKKCHWLKPLLVCQVKFAEWTHDSRLRQPAFLGLRADKDPGEVVREKGKHV